MSRLLPPIAVRACRGLTLVGGVVAGIVVLASTLAGAQGLPRETRQRILEAVVMIAPYDVAAGQFAPRSGSGTIISPDGHILTNYHVVGDLETREHFDRHGVFVTDPRAPEAPPRLTYWAHYVSSDPTHDLALIRISQYVDERPVPDAVRFTAMPVGNSNELVLGDPLTVVGYPGISGSTITFTFGMMSGWLGEDLRSGGKQWIKTDAKIARGNSGGGAFNERGELIGVPSYGVHTLEGALYEEQLYIRPIGLAWALIGPAVPSVVRTVDPPLPVPPDVPHAASSPLGSGTYGSVGVGETITATIAARPEGTGFVYNTYTVAVAAGTTELTISLVGDGDVDLAVKAGAEIVDYGDVDFLDAGTEPTSSYTYGAPPAGTIYVDVISAMDRPIAYRLSVSAAEAPRAEGPIVEGPIDEAPCNPLVPGSCEPDPTITAATTDSGTIGAIAFGQVATGRLRGMDDGNSYHTYFVDVPADTARLTISMTADVDLHLAAKFGSDIESYASPERGGDCDYLDTSATRGAEFVIVDPRRGRWYIDVFSGLGSSVTGSYTLAIR